MVQQIIDNYPHDEFLRVDGFDDCVIGVSHPGMVLVYDIKLIIDKLVGQGMTHTDAHEHYSFNIEGSYIGPKTPMFVQRDFEW